MSGPQTKPQKMPSDAGIQQELSCEEALLYLQEEMETIAYVASHTLQAPVRIMEHVHGSLKESLGNNISHDTREALQALQVQMIHMRNLIKGLQEYIRLDTFIPVHVEIDANEVMATVTLAMQEEIEAAGAVITCDALPVVWGHRGRLVRLFAQLIDNAIKFCGNKPPQIHVSAIEHDNNWIFCVEDNGIGIDDEYYDIIFRLFQRLHDDSCYQGYGIGLALARKIAASHAGRLWVESAPGKGSRFFFTLPGRDQDSTTGEPAASV